MENPVKMDDLGVPEFAKPPYRWAKMKDSPEKTGSAPSTRPEKPSLLEVEAILCISLHVFFHWTTCSQWGISDPDPRYIFDCSTIDTNLCSRVQNFTVGLIKRGGGEKGWCICTPQCRSWCPRLFVETCSGSCATQIVHEFVQQWAKQAQI